MSDSLIPLQQHMHTLCHQSFHPIPNLAYLTLHLQHIAEIQSLGLQLYFHHNIPHHMQSMIQYVPSGKGMAGVAHQYQIPIISCDLQENPHPHQAIDVQQLTAYQGVAYPILRPFYSFNLANLQKIEALDYMFGARKIEPSIPIGSQSWSDHLQHHTCIAVLGVAFQEHFPLDDHTWSFLASHAQMIEQLLP